MICELLSLVGVWHGAPPLSLGRSVAASVYLPSKPQP